MSALANQLAQTVSMDTLPWWAAPALASVGIGAAAGAACCCSGGGDGSSENNASKKSGDQKANSSTSARDIDAGHDAGATPVPAGWQDLPHDAQQVAASFLTDLRAAKPNVQQMVLRASVEEVGDEKLRLAFLKVRQESLESLKLSELLALASVGKRGCGRPLECCPADFTSRLESAQDSQDPKGAIISLLLETRLDLDRHNSRICGIFPAWTASGVVIDLQRLRDTVLQAVVVCKGGRNGTGVQNIMAATDLHMLLPLLNEVQVPGPSNEHQASEVIARQHAVWIGCSSSSKSDDGAVAVLLQQCQELCRVLQDFLSGDAVLLQQLTAGGPAAAARLHMSLQHSSKLLSAYLDCCDGAPWLSEQERDLSGRIQTCLNAMAESPVVVLRRSEAMQVVRVITRLRNSVASPLGGSHCERQVAAAAAFAKVASLVQAVESISFRSISTSANIPATSTVSSGRKGENDRAGLWKQRRWPKDDALDDVPTTDGVQPPIEATAVPAGATTTPTRTIPPKASPPPLPSTPPPVIVRRRVSRRSTESPLARE